MLKYQIVISSLILQAVIAINHDVWVGTGGFRQFQPSAISIHQGDTVTFKWASGNHSTTADDRSWDVKIQNSSDSFTVTLNALGTHRYYSKNYGWKRGFGMCGRIKVTPPPLTTGRIGVTTGRNNFFTTTNGITSGGVIPTNTNSITTNFGITGETEITTTDDGLTSTNSVDSTGSVTNTETRETSTNFETKVTSSDFTEDATSGFGAITTATDFTTGIDDTNDITTNYFTTGVDDTDDITTNYFTTGDHDTTTTSTSGTTAAFDITTSEISITTGEEDPFTTGVDFLDELDPTTGYNLPVLETTTGAT